MMPPTVSVADDEGHEASETLQRCPTRSVRQSSYHALSEPFAGDEGHKVSEPLGMYPPWSVRQSTQRAPSKLFADAEGRVYT